MHHIAERNKPKGPAGELLQAVADQWWYKIDTYLPQIFKLSPHEQVELFKSAKNEEVCLYLLRGEDNSFVPTARNERGESLLDVGIDNMYFTFVHRVVALGARSEVLDFQRLLDGSEEVNRMLDIILAKRNEAFDVLAAVFKTALDGNVKVMRKLFDSRVDVDFNHTCYPLSLAIEQENKDLAQLLIDRMETVGLPPYNEPRVAMYVLLNLFKPIKERVDATDVTRWTDYKLDMACKLADSVTGQHQFPCTFIEDVVNSRPGHPLIAKLLRIIDVQAEPGMLLSFFIQYDPTNSMAEDCLRMYIAQLTEQALKNPSTTHDGQDNAETQKQMILRHLIKQGGEVAYLVKIVLDEGVSPNYRLRFEDNGVLRCRTAVMHCMEPPGNVEIMKMLLRRSNTDVNVANERDLNAVQQCVVDIINNPIPFMDYVEDYAIMFTDLVRHGIETNVSEPAFYTSLFSYLCKLELGPLCLPLFHNTHNINAILNTTDNTLATMVNISLERLDSGLVDPATNPGCILDPRFFAPKLKNKWQAGGRSLAPAPVPVVLNVMGFLDAASLVACGQCCVRYYFLSLSHSLWHYLTEDLHSDFDTPLNDLLLSNKLLYRTYKTKQLPHLYVRTGEQEMTCIFTGTVIKKG
eukprot:NODE_349_length_2052_cov_72.303896_g343_i0.p1 GENE.NODE_349_length_2052_cov_72.303896_g343_i0~~NODE_349_length_2052_cov_72.303896_g343_i0.p1  ORF type:complete len:634 (-),score=140.86 NODE_349_length_2052_cov_72.303896_g343_i0:64-1965(-)